MALKRALGGLLALVMLAPGSASAQVMAPQAQVAPPPSAAQTLPPPPPPPGGLGTTRSVRLPLIAPVAPQSAAPQVSAPTGGAQAATAGGQPAVAPQALPLPPSSLSPPGGAGALPLPGLSPTAPSAAPVLLPLPGAQSLNGTAAMPRAALPEPSQSPPTAAPGAGAADQPPPAGSTAALGPAQTPDSSPFSPDADVLIETEILPVLDRFTHTAMALQNAVLRYCLVESAVSYAAVERSYRDAIEASAALLPLAFGSPEASAVPTRLLMRAASNAFSSSRLEAVMQGAPLPRSLAALAQEDAALLGLPAIEHLLLRTHYQSDLRREYRCRAAVPVVANIVSAALRQRQRWLHRAVDVHWQGDSVELAGRLRLRDLIQGTIDAADRIGFDLSEFKRQPRDNTASRFYQVRHSLPYLIAATDALRIHVGRLEKFVARDGPTAELLGDIVEALALSCEYLIKVASGGANEGRYLTAFEQAQSDIINDLPEAFGFDADAFSRSLSSLGVASRSTGLQP